MQEHMVSLAWVKPCRSSALRSASITGATGCPGGTGNIKKIGGKTFSYDLSSRLTSATIPGVSLPYRGYTYDVFGNLTQVAQGSFAQDPNLTSVTYTPNPATNRPQGASYDNSGRLFSYQGSTYSWDVLNNVTTVNTGSEPGSGAMLFSLAVGRLSPARTPRISSLLSSPSGACFWLIARSAADGELGGYSGSRAVSHPAQ